jgi:hypothetical protein
MPFIGTLKYKKSKKDDESFVGRPFYNLTAPFAYQDDRVKRDYVLTCPKGMETDFASIPEYIFFLDPKDPRWQRAAVIHDQACRLARAGKDINMREADAYLYYAMRECGATTLQSSVFWVWVRANHILKGEF